MRRAGEREREREREKVSFLRHQRDPMFAYVFEIRKRRKEKAHEHYEMRLGIFADDSSFAAHHFGILPCVPIECRSHYAGHLIVVSETTPHDTSETVLFKNTPLTRSEREKEDSDRCQVQWCKDGRLR